MEHATRMDDNWGYPDFRKPPYLHEICPTLFQGSLLLSLLFGSYKFPETHSSCVLDLSISMGKALHSRLTIEEWTRLGAQQIQSISGNERYRHMYFPANYIWEATIKTSWREGAKSKIDPQLSRFWHDIPIVCYPNPHFSLLNLPMLGIVWTYMIPQ